MFSNVDFDVVGFSSVNKKSNDSSAKRELRESSSQTERDSSEEGTQTIEKKDSKNQTEEVLKNLSDEYSVDNLAAFLKKISPVVLNELDKVEKSKAFTMHRDLVDEHEFQINLQPTNTIQSAAVPDIPEVRLSCLSWSCTGSMVGFGYETNEHTTWCSHNSSVHFYNINASNCDGKNPTYSIPIASCVTYVATHPFEPTIVAIGTTDGDMEIWDLDKADGDSVSIANVSHHKECITRASWETISSQLYLVTSSHDGFMYFFKVVPSLGSVTVSERYVMTNETDSLLPGISTYGFSLQTGVFVVALLNGELLHCSTFSAPTIPSTSYKNPVINSLVKRGTMVTDLKFSPFVAHIFVTCCLDKTFFVYSLKENTILHEIFLGFLPLGVTWSPSQGNAFFIWGESTKIYVYNSDTGKVIAELIPEAGGPIELIDSVAVTLKSSKLAVSTGNGKVLIMKTPPFFKT